MATLKALVVDDASFVRDLVKRTIRQRFPVFETTDAQNGRRAQSLMSTTRFDLILCDWEMPEMSGIELLQWMRDQPQYARVPFIMITSRGDKDHVVEAVKGGVSEYLGKPFSPDGLSSKIIKVMGRQLADAMAKGGKSMTSPVEALRESADLLTQKRENPPGSPPVSSPGPGAAGESGSPLLTKSPTQTPLRPSPQAASAVVDKAAARKSSTSVASVRFADTSLKSVVRDINLTEVQVIARRDQSFPGILDPAVVDIDVGEGQMARLNGYVQQLQAVDKRQDTDFISVTIRFVDEDPVKLADLSRFIARFRAGR